MKKLNIGKELLIEINKLENNENKLNELLSPE